MFKKYLLDLKNHGKIIVENFFIKAKRNAIDLFLLSVFVHACGSYLLSLWSALIYS